MHPPLEGAPQRRFEMVRQARRIGFEVPVAFGERRFRGVGDFLLPRLLEAVSEMLPAPRLRLPARIEPQLDLGGRTILQVFEPDTPWRDHAQMPRPRAIRRP